MQRLFVLVLTLAALATSGCAQCGASGRQADVGDLIYIPLMLVQAPVTESVAGLGCLDSTAPVICRERVRDGILTPTRWLARGVCEVVRLPVTLGDAWWKSRDDEEDEESDEIGGTAPPP